MLFKIAFRNILRNGRRSLMTASAIAVSAVAMILFGEYNDFAFLGLETQAVIQTGHLSVYQKGYFENGSGNPSAYSISGYKKVIALIEDDSELKPMVNVVTPTVSLFGIAGNFAINASKTFFGTGYVPSDRDKMRHWDAYHLRDPGWEFSPLAVTDTDINRGVVGVGMARMLGLCEALKLEDCPPMPKEEKPDVPASSAPSFDFAELAARDREPGAASADALQPRLDLLSATATGAPNVVSFYVNQAQSLGVKELDDMFVGMHVALAQELVYGRGEHKATSIVLQLHHTADLPKAKARLETLIAQHKLPLEIHEFTELNTSYVQIRGFMTVLFGFLTTIMVIIVIFTVVNTMTMSVMERVNEIGTGRAMGVRRSGVRRLFVIEGCLLGMLSATAGVILATLLALWFNHAHIMYTPPTQSHPVPLLLYVNDYGLLAKVWIGMVLISTIASLIPASRAAKMNVVDALRHV